MTDEILDMVNDLIVDHEFEIINGEDFDKFTVKQYESDYDTIDAGYNLYRTIKVGKTVYEGKDLKISIDWSCMCADDEFGGEDYEDFEFNYNVEQICDFHNTKIIIVSNEKNDYDYLIVEHKGRLTRYGFSYIEAFCAQKNIEILVINEEEPKSRDEELLQDFVSIVTSFCSRIYGRKRKLKTKQIIEEIKNNE